MTGDLGWWEGETGRGRTPGEEAWVSKLPAGGWGLSCLSVWEPAYHHPQS